LADLKLQFGVGVPGKALVGLQAVVNSMTAGLRKAQLAAAKALAEEAKRRVQQGYLEATFPRSPFTSAVYAQGKAEGSWPRRELHGGSPMQRTAGLARYVKLRELSGGVGFQVEIDPQATYAAPSGDPADWRGPSYSKAPRPVPVAMVAEQLENPVPIVLQITQKMLGYLQSLRRGEAGHPKGLRAPRSRELTGRTLVINPAPRPVWRKMIENLHTASPIAFAAFDAALRKLGA